MLALKNVFFNWIAQEFSQNKENSILLALDLGWPLLNEIKQKFPQKVINTGVTEQNTLLLAIGLASEGFTVYIYGISQFTIWRPAEIFNLYSKYLNRIKIIGNGGGFGYGILGSSHHSLNDYGLLLLTQKNFRLFLPRNPEELFHQLNSNENTFCYYRLINISSEKTSINPNSNLQKHLSGKKATILCIGNLINDLFTKDIEADWFSIGSWPLSEENFSQIIKSVKKTKKIITLEEHYYHGSISQIIKEKILDYFHHHCHFKIKFIPITPILNSPIVGDRNFLLTQNQISLENIKHHVYN